MNIQDNTSVTETVERRILRLPIEIQEHIIGSLDNEHDAGTIANCALVCRAWLPRSRSKLYSKVYLWEHQQWDRFKDLVLRCKSESTAGYLRRVRELYVSSQNEEFFDKKRIRRWTRWNKNGERPWAHLALDYCSLHFTGLTYLDMHCVDFSLSHSMAICSGCYYHSLTKLHFCCCTFIGILQLRQFMVSFPALSELTLNRLSLHSTVVPPYIPKGGHPLTRLRLQAWDDVMAAVSQWLSQAELVRNLRYLEWWPFDAEKVEEEWKTLTKAIDGPSLQELCCMMSHTWKSEYSFRPSLLPPLLSSDT